VTQPVERPVTSEQALGHAVRLLLAAEDETDRGLMKHYERLAETWTTVAAVQAQREHTM